VKIKCQILPDQEERKLFSSVSLLFLPRFPPTQFRYYDARNSNTRTATVQTESVKEGPRSSSCPYREAAHSGVAPFLSTLLTSTPSLPRSNLTMSAFPRCEATHSGVTPIVLALSV
jgi:hypothetical protein